MSTSSKGLILWRTRLVLFGVWATLVLLWRRGGYLGFPTESRVLAQEWSFVWLLVLAPGAALLLGAPIRRYAAGFLGVLLVGVLIAQSVASWQEERFASSCRQTQGPVVIHGCRFPGHLGGSMLFIRSPDGSESFHFND